MTPTLLFDYALAVAVSIVVVGLAAALVVCLGLFLVGIVSPRPRQH